MNERDESRLAEPRFAPKNPRVPHLRLSPSALPVPRLPPPTTMRSTAAVSSALLRARPIAARVAPRLTRPSSAAHGEETFESFTERYVQFFGAAQDLYEVQRGLNNAFSHDLVPAPSVVEAALRASRRVNDYATAVRVFEGIREKVENKKQYEAYLEELKPVREELGALLFMCSDDRSLILRP